MKQIFTIMIIGFLLATGCTTPGKKTAIGTGVGAAGGAGIGAAIGSASGHAGKGALIGAAAGALLGGAVGNRLDKQTKELAQYAETRRTDEGILVSLKGDILFDSGKASIKPDASNRVKEIATILAKYPEDRIVVVGHTDNVGSDEYNQRLSENRANAVRVQLLSKGIPNENISTVGMGESQPATSNASKKGRAQNRRVELAITPSEQ
ncbi:MAG TPA: OmpA family protein [Nitrospiria bacterium]|jgi:outer membrane protein OmpA-like peptidoglycan-associated protein